jgi:hypothetical protein
MIKLNAECKEKLRKLLQFFAEVSKSRHSSLVPLEHPRKGIAPPWSSQEPGAHYEVILCHFGAVDPSRLLTTLSQVTNKFSWVITAFQTPPSCLGDADHQE